MTDKFVVGEVAIYDRPGATLHGTEVTITKARHVIPMLRNDSPGSAVESGQFTVYGIDMVSKYVQPGKPLVCQEQYLRKKPDKKVVEVQEEVKVEEPCYA